MAPMKKIVCSLVFVLIGLVSGSASAAPVTFWFAGTVTSTNNPDNALPANVDIGTPFYGRITYDVANLTFSNVTTFTNGTVANYYFRPTAGFSFLFQAGGHTVTNKEIKDIQWAGNVSVYDNFNDADELTFDIGQNGLVIDGMGDTNWVVSFFLRDNSKTALTNAGLPSQPPSLAAFPDIQTLNWYHYNPLNQSSFVFGGEITQISTNELVALNIRRSSSSTVLVSWPRAISGGQLQSVTNVTSTNWQNVPALIFPSGMENTATLSVSGQQFYRLKLH